MKCEGLVLDLDGTLYDAESAYAESLKQIGLDISAPDYLRARSLVKNRLPEGHTSARSRWLYLKMLLELRGNFSPALLAKQMDAYEMHLEKFIVEQWARLNRHKLFEKICAKYPTVILTNETTRTQILKLRAVDPVGKLFTNIVTSEEIWFEKPDLRLFREACGRLQLPPEECCMIGDDFERDIQPALKLGMQGIWTHEFNNKVGVKKQIERCVSIARLDEISNLLL